MIFRKSAFRKSHRFLIDLGANMAPFWLPKTFQILPKIDPKMHQIFDRFLHRFFLHFGSILGPKLGPCWPHFPPKWGGPVEGRPLLCCAGFFSGFFRAGPWGTPSDRAPEPMGYPSDRAPDPMEDPSWAPLGPNTVPHFCFWAPLGPNLVPHFSCQNK